MCKLLTHLFMISSATCDHEDVTKGNGKEITSFRFRSCQKSGRDVSYTCRKRNKGGQNFSGLQNFLLINFFISRVFHYVVKINLFILYKKLILHRINSSSTLFKVANKISNSFVIIVFITNFKNST